MSRPPPAATPTSTIAREKKKTSLCAFWFGPLFSPDNARHRRRLPPPAWRASPRFVPSCCPPLSDADEEDADSCGGSCTHTTRGCVPFENEQYNLCRARLVADGTIYCTSNVAQGRKKCCWFGHRSRNAGTNSSVSALFGRVCGRSEKQTEAIAPAGESLHTSCTNRIILLTSSIGRMRMRCLK